jgi:hypothetical protein
MNRRIAVRHALLNEKTQTKADLVGWDRAYRIPEASDIVVNATSIGLFPHVEGRPDLDLASLRGGRQSFSGFNTTHYSGLEVSILLGLIAASIFPCIITPETPKPISVGLF